MGWEGHYKGTHCTINFAFNFNFFSSLDFTFILQLHVLVSFLPFLVIALSLSVFLFPFLLPPP
jgi:hypothetical protein